MFEFEKQQKTSLAIRLTGYGLAAGALALTSGNSSAQAIYSGMQNLTFDEPGILNPIDLNGDGVTDFNVGLAWDSYILNGWSTYSAFIQNPAGNAWVGDDNGAFVLSKSYSVGTWVSWTNYVESYYNLGIAPSNDFLGAGNVFIGVGFIIPSPTATIHLGWMRVNIDPLATEFTVVDWAYQTNPLASVRCGNLAATLQPPEPSLDAPVSGIVMRDIPVDITFSETVKGFELSGIHVEGGHPLEGSLETTDQMNFSAMIRPAAEGFVTVKIPGSVALDMDNNPNMPGKNRLYFYYLEVPKITLSTSVEQPVSSAFDVTIQFSEEVTTLHPDELILTNARIEPGSLVKVNPALYEVRLIPENTGFVVLEIPADVVQDTDMHGNLASDQLIVEADFDSPRVALHTNSPEPVNGTFKVYITFGEPVEGFNEGDIRISNGFVSAGSLSSADNQIFTVNIIPAGTGEVTIYIPENAARDEDGTGNLASAPLIVQAELDALAAGNTIADPVTIFPNPTSGVFRLHVPADLLSTQLQVYNSNGNKIFTEFISTEEMDVDLSGFPRGIYLVRIVYGGSCWMEKIVLD